jgi:major membrane immunogen (membrane-anchored lipoprotein)
MMFRIKKAGTPGIKQGIVNGIILLTAALVSLAAFSSCNRDFTMMHDGYYTAESAEFDSYGWKEFVTILVKDNRITAVEYNAKNSSGFIKSWDMNYMRLMASVSGTYPDEYTRIYAGELLLKQDADSVDVLSGATDSHAMFRILAKSAIRQAERGDTAVAFVEFAPPAPHE